MHFLPREITIIGLGYVGLPLAVRFADAGLRVNGLDNDSSKVEQLAAGESYLDTVPAECVSACVAAGKLIPTRTYDVVAASDAVIICVPTPLTRYREPDLSFVVAAAEAIAPYLREGMVVVLESTSYPGTTEEVLAPVLERISGLRAGRDFSLGYSPEREDPGNKSLPLESIPKLVSGLTLKCREEIAELYRRVIREVVPVDCCRTAEASKLLENIFRSVNIALVNELKIVFGAMGIDIWNVIAAAKTKPFGFMPFYPGPGLGGHCIPIDPFYLTWKAREVGEHTRFVELAGEINTRMPEYVLRRIAAALNASKKALNGSRILVVGVAYKANVGDLRMSPALRIMALLRTEGAIVEYYDPHVPVIRLAREDEQWNGTRSILWQRENVEGFDAALIVTDHRAIAFCELAAWSSCIIDTRNAMRGLPCSPGQIWAA